MLLALAQLNPTIGAFSLNRKKIISSIEAARKKGADIALFPELSLCGYPPEDLLLLPSFIERMEEELALLVKECKGIIAIVGLARKNPAGGEKGLLNSAVVIEDGKILGYYDKMLLPDYDVFSERRYFDPGETTGIWELKGKRVAITICEDIWAHAEILEGVSYAKDPIKMLQGEGVELLLNLSASPFFVGREKDRERVCLRAAKSLGCPVAMANQVGGNDSLLFEGRSLFVEGERVATAKGFSEELFFTDSASSQKESDPLEDLFNALVLGTKDYFAKVGCHKAVLGLSGGIDSALVAVIVANALGKENLTALLMPSRYTTKESSEDAKKQAMLLGISLLEIPIEKPFTSYLELLEPLFKGREEDATEENLQARIRGMLLMAYSNKFGAMVVGTGNKSELAMGYATLYGDMCGGLEIIGDVTKVQVEALCKWLNRKKEIIVERIITKPPSAELKRGQKDSDSLPPYSVIDRVVEGYVHEHLSPEQIAKKEGIELALVKELVRKIHLNEYKRVQAPPGLRVTKKSFTKGRRFPIAQQWNIENDNS